MKQYTLIFSFVFIFTSTSFLVHGSAGAIMIIGDTTLITKRIITVSTAATTSESGTKLVSALNSIDGASEDNPYLLKIEPGIYNLGNNSLDMKEFVDIQGSGENTTKITGSINESNIGVLNGADNAELRFLTVKNTGGGVYANAIYNENASPKLTNVTAIASGSAPYNRSVYNYSSSPIMTNVTGISSGGTHNYCIFNYFSSPIMTNVTATASEGVINIAVYNLTSSPTMTNVMATGYGGSSNDYGLYNYGDVSTVIVDRCSFKGSTSSIYNDPDFVLNIGTSKLDGPVNDSGTWNCVNCYDGAYKALGGDCQ